MSALGRLIRKRRRQLIALVLLGGLLGSGAALLDPGHAAASRVLLQGPRDKADVPTETELVTSQVVLDRAAEVLNWGVSGEQLRSSVSAEPLSGNVLEIRCTAGDATKARQLTDQVAEQYLRFSTGLVSETLRLAEEGRRQRVSDLRARLADAESRLAQIDRAGASGAEPDLLRATVRSSRDEISDIEGQSHASALEFTLNRSSIKLIEPAVVVTGAIPLTAMAYVLGGIALFGLGGLVTYLVLASRDHRLVRPDDVAAALGASVVSEVPALNSRAREAGGRLGSTRRLHWDTQAMHVDANSVGLRYRRLFAKLREAGGSGRIPMIVVFDDDADGIDAVTRLVVAAGRAGGVCLVCDDPDLQQRLEPATQDPTCDLAIRPSDQHDPADSGRVLRVARVDPACPTIPEWTLSTSVVVAVGSGTRTPGELLVLSDACTDAGQRLIGVIVVLPALGGSETEVLSETPASQPRVVEAV